MLASRYVVRRLWPLVLILGGIAIAYHNAFSGKFVFDDHTQVLENAAIHQLWPPWRAMFETKFPARPLPYYSFALDYAMHGGSLFGYHLTNILVHIAVAVSLFLLVLVTLERPGIPGSLKTRREWIAGSLALIWGVHPLTTQAVTYIYQRIESMASLAYVLTLLFLALSQRTRRPTVALLLSVLACAVGVGCKEILVTAPLAALWYDRVFLATSWRELWSRRWGYYVGLASTWGLIAALVVFQKSRYLELVNPTCTRVEYLLSQCGVIVHYWQLAVWPVGLCLDYGWPVARSWSEIVPPGIALTAVLLFTLWLMIRRPRVGFVAGMFFLILAPTSSIVVVSDLTNDHRVYLALACVWMLILLAAWSLHLYVSHRSWPTRQWSMAILPTLLTLVVIAYVSLTIARNRDYHSDEAMWRKVVADRPLNARAHGMLSLILYGEQKCPDEVLFHAREAVRLNPTEPLYALFLARYYVKQGTDNEAINYFQQALTQPLCEPKAYLELAEIMNRRGDVVAQAALLERALKRMPTSAEASEQLLSLLLRGSLPREQAQPLFDLLCRVQPHSSLAWSGRALLLEANGDRAAAARDYNEAAKVNIAPGNACRTLADLLATDAPTSEALLEAHRRLALELEHAGVLRAALAHWERAHSLAGDVPGIETKRRQLQEQLRAEQEAAAALREQLR